LALGELLHTGSEPLLSLGQVGHRLGELLHAAGKMGNRLAQLPHQGGQSQEFLGQEECSTLLPPVRVFPEGSYQRLKVLQLKRHTQSPSVSPSTTHTSTPKGRGIRALDIQRCHCRP